MTRRRRLTWIVVGLGFLAVMGGWTILSPRPPPRVTIRFLQQTRDASGVDLAIYEITNEDSYRLVLMASYQIERKWVAANPIPVSSQSIQTRLGRGESARLQTFPPLNDGPSRIWIHVARYSLSERIFLWMRSWAEPPLSNLLPAPPTQLETFALHSDWITLTNAPNSAPGHQSP